jgi:hypothetical protein
VSDGSTLIVQAARSTVACRAARRRDPCVHVVTAQETAAACPSCGVVSTSVKARVVTSPRDIGCGQDRIVVRWNKNARETTEPTSDVHRALRAGRYSIEELSGELGEVISGQTAGRTSDNVIIAKFVGIARKTFVAAEVTLARLTGMRPPAGQRDRAGGR